MWDLCECLFPRHSINIHCLKNTKVVVLWLFFQFVCLELGNKKSEKYKNGTETDRERERETNKQRNSVSGIPGNKVCETVWIYSKETKVCDIK